MRRLHFARWFLCALASLTNACSTAQYHFTPLGGAYTSKPDNADVLLISEGLPQRPFVRISRLDVHLEKTHFIPPSFAEAEPFLLKQARLSGADAIIEIKDDRSRVGETFIYHVTATGIRYQ